jgi:O-antigen ligase
LRTTIVQYGLTILAGAILAIMLHKLWSLETRYFVVTVAGIILTCLSVFFIRWFHDFLLVAFFLAIPVAGFVKTLFLMSQGYDERTSGIILYSGVLGVGVMDILLFGLYAVWFIRIFVLRTERLPIYEKGDGLVLFFIIAYILSSIGAPDGAAAKHAIMYLLRFAAIYFYVSRNFEPRHIRWLFVTIVVIILGESALAVFQYMTGKLIGLAMDRGAGIRLDEQYTVPGIENRNRATGTAYESHTFGTYMAILTQFAFVMASLCFQNKRFRLLSSALFSLALVAVLVSYSRSAWLSCAIALALAWFVHIKIWHEKQIMLPTMIVGLIVIILSPWMLSIIIERFTSAEGLLSARFDQFPIAWNIWKDHFLFGYGVGNYMDALKYYNEPGILELPVHNVFLWLAAETGIFGVVIYYWLAFAALTRSWKILRRRNHPHRRLALAVFCGLIAYLLDGLTDPLYREPVIYSMFWVMVALSVALVRIDREHEQQVAKETVSTG